MRNLLLVVENSLLFTVTFPEVTFIPSKKGNVLLLRTTVLSLILFSLMNINTATKANTIENFLTQHIQLSNTPACQYLQERGNAALSLLKSPDLFGHFEIQEGVNSMGAGLRYDLVNIKRIKATNKYYAADCDRAILEKEMYDIVDTLSRNLSLSGGMSPVALKQRKSLLNEAKTRFDKEARLLRDALKSGSTTLPIVQAFESRLQRLTLRIVDTNSALALAMPVSTKKLHKLPRIITTWSAAITRKEYASGKLRSLQGTSVFLKAGVRESTSGLSNGSLEASPYVGIQFNLKLGKFRAQAHERNAANLVADATLDKSKTVLTTLSQLLRILGQRNRSIQGQISVIEDISSLGQADIMRISNGDTSKSKVLRLGLEINHALQEAELSALKRQRKENTRILQKLRVALNALRNFQSY